MRRVPLKIFAVAAGCAGLGLLVVQSGPHELAGALASFDLRLLPLLLALVIADYALRFWRWHLLANIVSGRLLPLKADLAVFLAANVLLFAPARAGDWTRSIYARNLFGVPASVTAPVPLLERIVDIAIMGLLAVFGAVAFGASPVWAIAGLLLAAVTTGLFATRPVRDAGVSVLDRLTGGRLATPAAAFFDNLDALWRPLPLAVASGLGLVAWLCECLAFFVVLWGLGLTPSLLLGAQASFIYPVGNLAGSLSMLPSGLGVAEGSITGLTTSVVGAMASQAFAAALIIRLAIVGFGVVSGLPGLAFVSRAGSCEAAPVEARTVPAA